MFLFISVLIAWFLVSLVTPTWWESDQPERYLVCIVRYQEVPITAHRCQANMREAHLAGNGNNVHFVRFVARAGSAFR